MSQPMEPTLAALGGDGLGQIVRRHWLAMRPAFLTASIMPVVVGTAWGRVASGHFDVWAALLALAGTALVHAGANVINDVSDELGGSDRANTERIFPYTGGSRFLQSGVMSLMQMRRFGVGLVAAAMLLGAVLALLKGPTVVALGLVGIALALAVAVAMIVAMSWSRQLPAFAVLLLGLAFMAARGIGAPSGTGREALRGSIENTLGIHAIGSVWIAVCVWFGG